MISLRSLLALIATAGCITGCAGGSAVRPSLPDDAQRRASFCNNYRSAARSTQSSRSASNTFSSSGCTIIDGPFDSLFFDVQSFLEMVDATQGADPCYAAKPRCGDDQYSFGDNIIADPGGPAKRGDNCTQVNGYAIGYDLGVGSGANNTVTAPGQPIPATNSSATIVNQSQVYLENLSMINPVGWLLFTQDKGTWFVPNLAFGFNAGALSGQAVAPGAYRISPTAKSSRQFLNAIRGIFNLIANQNGVSLTAPVSKALQGSGGNINNVPCNTSNLA
ncbi:MAG: hypothetical protein QOF71_2137 [Candidatus Eremiobacteraeota bacterium]|jgi:hypothetical protein|nr:hypothetical protein [Candidatus Eremiobacteraeota bacterium]